MIILYNFLLYVMFPLFLSALFCFTMHFMIGMCSPLIIKLFTDIGIEKQCSKINGKHLFEQDKNKVN